MLALKSKFALAILAGLLSTCVGTAIGQQTPSQRYSPVPPHSLRGTASDSANLAPRSVHMPPQNVRQLSAAPRFRSAQPNMQAQSSQGTSFTFSDAPNAAQQTRAAQATPSTRLRQTSGQAQRGTIMQTSYQTDANGEPIVPDILAGSTPATNQNSTPRVNTPADFEARMQQVRGSSPRIAPQDFQAANQIKQQMENVRQQVLAREQSAQNSTEPVATLAQEEITAQNQAAQNLAAQRLASAQFEANREAHLEEQRLIEEQRLAAQEAALAAASQPTVDSQPIPEGQVVTEQEISASEFISQLQTEAPVESVASESAPLMDTNTAPTLVADPSNPSRLRTPQIVRDENIRQVSAETEAPRMATISLSAPAIEVETYGPQTIGINKPATFKVSVANQGSRPAERILVGINLPEWVDLENVSLTTGGKEITDGKDQARLVWSVDHVPGNSEQTLTIVAVPRKAEMFDLGVEWTLVPRKGTANIQVTEPKLEMNIVGPGEIQFGEREVYHVTVRNPGTGTAENVVVKLPEALGGERSAIGDIAPGSDQMFQVEMIAQTAGELNLVTTAMADGNLEVSAERLLMVRRANLGIVIDGPGMKYSGSVGQYMVSVTNSGDAAASEVIAAMALPNGVTYLSGIESVKQIEGGVRWHVGSLEPGQTRDYKINCQLDTSGELKLDVGAQGAGKLQTANFCKTNVETVADLVLTVQDPKGPLPTGESTIYEITVRNRGSRSAKGVDLVMQFSDGIEPRKADGLTHKIVPGQVLFTPIKQIDPGQEMSFKVSAEALKSGTHVFRAQLTCDDSDSREIAEGTTRFFGEEVPSQFENTANAASEAGSQDFSTDFKR